MVLLIEQFSEEKEIAKEILNILNHKRNANQNYSKISSPCQIGNHQENNKCWQELEEKGTLTHWWECKLVQPLWKSVWILNKLKRDLHMTWPYHSWACI
jgi:hypothetical protein